MCRASGLLLLFDLVRVGPGIQHGGWWLCGGSPPLPDRLVSEPVPGGVLAEEAVPAGDPPPAA
ncbi:MAG TPA: hypothetical protein PLF39_08155, partial [Synergistales bacterium]|nr:hypothetical protein [Synergistales bacterium]